LADPMSDVIVLIPGIGGSVLQRDGKDVWAFSGGAVLRGVLSLGRSVNRLQLDGDDPDADDLGDGVVASRLMPDLHVLPGLGWKIDGYGRTRDRLLAAFDVQPGHNYFELAYDWRRDNRVAARALARQAHTWLSRWREESGNGDAKLILIGHSMGGVVARLYLELLEGWRDTRTLISYGTPYSGSLNALRFLANGFERGWGPLTIDLSGMLRSFTSVYQLLPSYRCLESAGGEWLPLDDITWDGTSVDDDRLRAAISLHRDLRAAVDDRLAAGHPGYSVRPVVGDFQHTGWAARRVGDGVEVMPFRTPNENGGDGTVPTVSAVPHELLEELSNATFVSQQHASLQNDDPVFTHVAGVLRGAAIGTVPVFPAVDESVALELEDATTDEPFVVRARPARSETQLTAFVEPAAGGEPRRVPMVDGGGGWQEAMLEGLAATDYRVTVTAVGSHAVTDVASVIDLDEIEQAANE
jgi:pimeloyl-ACP methyl ester carboxylesterase